MYYLFMLIMHRSVSFNLNQEIIQNKYVTRNNNKMSYFVIKMKLVLSSFYLISQN